MGSHPSAIHPTACPGGWGCLGAPAVLPHMCNIPRACSDAAWAIPAWGVALSCQHSVHFMLRETHSKWLLRVRWGFGLLLSRLWGSAIADLGVGWLPSRRKPSLCVGDGIFVSAFSLLSFAWLMLSHWCVLLTVAPHFGMNSLRSGFTFPSGLMLRMSSPAHPPSPTPPWHSPPASFFASLCMVFYYTFYTKLLSCITDTSMA